MHLPKFELLAPSTLAQASQLLRDYGKEAGLLAGGTDLFPRMKYGLLFPQKLVSLKRIAPREPIVASDDHLQLDALMPLADVVRSEIIHRRAPLLAEAALCVGSNQIRHMGTLGGNICLEPRCLYYNQSHAFQFVEPCFKRHGDRCYLSPKGEKCRAVFMADTVQALISSGASLEITSTAGNRTIPLETFYRGDPLQPFDLSRGEIIARVHIPAPPQLGGTAFIKLSVRGGLEFAALSVAVLLEKDPHDSTCRGAKITLGAIAPAPIRIKKAEAFMAGRHLSADLFRKTAQIVASETRPVSHHGYSAGYLRYALEIHTRRALALAAERITAH